MSIRNADKIKECEYRFVDACEDCALVYFNRFGEPYCSKIDMCVAPNGLCKYFELSAHRKNNIGKE